MISIFPPNYGLVPIFNISYSSIIEIIENGYSDSFNSKCEKLLNTYKDSKGIDEDDMPFIKRLKARCLSNNMVNDRKVIYENELSRTLYFLDDVLNNSKTYFSNYVKTGRKLKSIDKDLYIKHKLSSISYTPFGVFNTRESVSFLRSSNFLYFDIDFKLSRDNQKKLINFFIDDPYIKSSWLSFSGKGFAFIVESEWTTELQLKKCYYKLIEYFTQELIKIGIRYRIFDTQVCNINRMNFISQNLIKDKTDNLKYKFEDYSDSLYSLLHDTYKNTSLKEIPDKLLTEDDAEIYNKQFKSYTISDKERILITDEKMLYSLLNKITKNLSFNGSTDYNTAIKEYINKVFIYQIDSNIIETFLFEKIPYSDKTVKTFEGMWNVYSKYSSFYSIEPLMYI